MIFISKNVEEIYSRLPESKNMAIEARNNRRVESP